MEWLNFYESENELDEIKYMLISDDDDDNQIFLCNNIDNQNTPKDDRNEKDKQDDSNPVFLDDTKRQDEGIIVNQICNLQESQKIESIDEEINGNGRHCVCNPICYFHNKKKIVEYVQSVVLVGQHDKFTKIDKVIAFRIICEYILKLYPNLEHDKKFRKLSRNEKRMVPQLNGRFNEIDSYIYEIFQTEYKEEIILRILQKIDANLIENLEKEISIKAEEKKIKLLNKYKKELDEIEKKMENEEIGKA